MAELTPMMKQYLEIKKDNPDSILFFRLGDFYEMFADDAKLASKELDLTLTSRDHGKHAKPEEERVPMCGIPYHASESYIARLIAKGYKVAICEQMEDPATAKGLVKRDIIRVVTPGTVIDAACLDDKSGNYLCGIYLDSQGGGAAFCDLSTGETHLTAFSGKDTLTHIINELGRFSPAEAILSDGAFSEKALTDVLTDKFHCRYENGGERRFRLAEAEKNIRAQFGEEAFSRLPAGEPAAAMALGGLLSYLYETQKTDLSHIRELDYYRQGRFMELDLAARRNLELTETLRSKEKKGSLLWVLDKTKTPMGGPDAPQLAGAAPAVRDGHRPPQQRRGRVGERHHPPGGADCRDDRPGGYGAAHRPHRLRHRRRPGSDLPPRRHGKAAQPERAAHRLFRPPPDGADGRTGHPGRYRRRHCRRHL